jgi:hypothetical protein
MSLGILIFNYPKIKGFRNRENSLRFRAKACLLQAQRNANAFFVYVTKAIRSIKLFSTAVPGNESTMVGLSMGSFDFQGN